MIRRRSSNIVVVFLLSAAVAAKLDVKPAIATAIADLRIRVLPHPGVAGDRYRTCTAPQPVTVISDATPPGMPPPDSPLGRAMRYVAEYESALGNIIADERYLQEVKLLSNSYHVGRRTTPVTKRYLLAQFLMVRVPASGEWMGFRDVTRVDDHDRPGRAAARDAERRPLQEILGAGPVAEDQLRRLSREATRDNIGDVIRTVNVPTFTLLVLRPSNEPRFHFARKGRHRLAGVDTEVVAFDEIATPTIVRNTRGDNLPLSGALWIEPVKGIVVQTELETHDPEQDVRGRIEVRYRPDERLSAWVPVEMSERYILGPKAGALEQRISCLARYSNFRRARVEVKIR